MAIKCPDCGSETCQSFRVITEEGTQFFNGRGRSAGVGISGNGGFGVGVGKTRMKGVQQTSLAKKTAPPAQRDTGEAIAWALLVFVVSVGISVGTKNAVVLGIGLFICTLIGLNIYQTEKYNKTTWVKIYEKWEQSYLCRTCGKSFVISPPIGAGTEEVAVSRDGLFP